MVAPGKYEWKAGVNVAEQRINIVDITDVPKWVEPVKPNNKIYVRSVTGAIEQIRRFTGLFFLALFICLPWLQCQGQQAILLDFSAQRFHIFGLTLWPQDLTLLAWIFIIAAFALFVVTAIWGRVWCGFMCPQTVFTFLFVWVEEKVEGARNKRIHLDRQKPSIAKLTKKATKHFIWVAIALITSLTFVGYFTPIDALFVELATGQIGFWPAFYVSFFAACTYANAGWMREVMCTHMCPYSRFQSSMFDNDTVTVTYDRVRGEGRGPRPKRLTKEAYQSKGLGDCIDCNLCVQVCPTGIDIRNGLQYECINCGACVDACNGVMAKMGYAKGLVSYTALNLLKGKQVRMFRPKVVGYFLVLAIMLGAFAVELMTRPLHDIDIVRDRTSLYRENINGNVENIYTLIVRNKAQHAQSFTLSVQGLELVSVKGDELLTVDGSSLAKFPITLEVDPAILGAPVTRFEITVTSALGDTKTEQITFLYRSF